jgi:hypothetical protein
LGEQLSQFAIASKKKAPALLALEHFP